MAKNRNYEKPEKEIPKKEYSKQEDSWKKNVDYDNHDNTASVAYGHIELNDSVNDASSGGDSDSSTDIKGINHLNDQDSILDPNVAFEGDSEDSDYVKNSGGDVPDGDGGHDYDDGRTNFEITAKVETGETFAENDAIGIGFDYGKDIATGTADASSTVTTYVEAFNQDLSTGKNAQLSEVNLSVVIDYSSSMMPPSKYPHHRDKKSVKSNKNENDDDSVIKVLPYDISQSNSFYDDDRVTNPSVKFYAGDAAAFSLTAKVNTGDTKSDTGVQGYNSNPEGDDSSVFGYSTALGEVITTVEAFTQYISTGENVQLNTIEVYATGDNSSSAGDDIKALKVQKNDGDSDYGQSQKSSKKSDGKPDTNNDFDGIIDVSHGDNLVFDDFINDPLSGAGNDMSFDFDQVNSLQDNDHVSNPEVTFHGADGDGVQFSIGANIYAGDTISGGGTESDYDSADSLYQSGDSDVTGANSAVSYVVTNVEAFTQSIVMGANVQANTVELTVVGGDGTSDDDIDLLG